MDDPQGGGQIINLDATDLTDPSGSLFVSVDQLQALTFQQPPIITITGEGGTPLVSIHPDGHLEYGPTYEPDAAARTFWDAVQRLAPLIGANLPPSPTGPELPADQFHRAQQDVEYLIGQNATSWTIVNALWRRFQAVTERQRSA